jgi:hypothetical protein
MHASWTAKGFKKIEVSVTEGAWRCLTKGQSDLQGIEATTIPITPSEYCHLPLLAALSQ